MTESSLAVTEFVVRSIAQTAVDKEQEFSDLDAVVGDGDFGFSLARGFEIVLSDWETFDRSSPSAFLRQIAVTLTSHIGGTSGPIWGTAFLRAASSVKDKDELSGADVVVMLRAAAEGIKARGNSDLGDKTLLDTLIPATAALEMQLDSGADARQALQALAETARTSAEATSLLQAKRGRASYTGERSIGSPDAGAMALAIIAERLSREWSDPS